MIKLNTLLKPNSQPVPSGSSRESRSPRVPIHSFFRPTNYSEITQRIATFYAVNPITFFPDKIEESDGTPFFGTVKEALHNHVMMM